MLYQVVQAHWDEFQERAEEGGGLPSFVTKEVDAYLTCGILEHGFQRLRVRSNRGSRLVRALLAAKASGVRFISRLKSDGS